MTLGSNLINNVYPLFYHSDHPRYLKPPSFITHDIEYYEMLESARLILERMLSRYKYFKWFDAGCIFTNADFLSFYLDNQLYHVLVEDIAGQVKSPIGSGRVVFISNHSNAIPCVLKMRQLNSAWMAYDESSPLMHAVTSEAIVIPDEKVGQKIELTYLEIKNLVVSEAQRFLLEIGYEFVSRIWWDPDNGPDLWVKRNNNIESVSVFFSVYPDTPYIPEPEVILYYQKFLEVKGHFLSYSIMPVDEDNLLLARDEVNLYRGDRFQVTKYSSGLFSKGPA